MVVMESMKPKYEVLAGMISLGGDYQVEPSKVKVLPSKKPVEVPITIHNTSKVAEYYRVNLLSAWKLSDGYGEWDSSCLVSYDDLLKVEPESSHTFMTTFHDTGIMEHGQEVWMSVKKVTDTQIQQELMIRFLVGPVVDQDDNDWQAIIKNTVERLKGGEPK